MFSIKEQIKQMQLNVLRISLTNECNASCKFCHNENQKMGCRGKDVKPKRSHLDESQFEYIADFFKPYFNEVKFTGGEPTLVINFEEIIKIFSKKGYICSMTTNGFI